MKKVLILFCYCVINKFQMEKGIMDCFPEEVDIEMRRK